MRRGGKGHKGKGLTVPIVNIMPQVLRLERDSRRRTKREAILEVRNPEGPIVAPSRQRGRIRAPRRPFSPFRSPVLPRIPKALVEPPRLLRQRPNQALSCRHDLRLIAKHRVFKRQGRVNPLPAGFLEGRQYIRQDVGIQRIKMKQDRVPYIALENVQRKLTIERRAIEQMRSEVVAIRGHRSVGLLPEAIDQALAYVPVRSINGDMPDAVSALLEQRTKTIALLGGVSLLQEGVSEQRFAIVIGTNHLFIFQKIQREVGITGLLPIELVRIGMVANEVARFIPGGKQFRAVGFIHAHPANKKRRANIFRRDRFQNPRVGFLPFQDRSELESGIVQRERNLWAGGIVGRTF